jgi:predicted lipase
MGFKNVYTIGWDLTDPKKIGTITHFSDTINTQKYKNTQNILDKDYTNEMILQANNVIHVYNYFKSKNMNITIVGHKSFIDKNIPRIYLT